MADFNIYLCTFVLALFLVYWWLRSKRRKVTGKTIPGPPLFEGIKTFIKGVKNNTLHLYLPAWATKYGEMVQVDLLVRKVVFFNNADLFREIVKDGEFRDDTNDRPVSFVGDYITGGEKELILASYGSAVAYKRKLFHNLLKFYGEGRGRFEELMLETLSELVQSMKGQTEVDLPLSIQNYILRLVGFLLTGDISTVAKSNLDKIKAFSESAENMYTFENETFLVTLPFLRLVPGLRFKRLYDDAVRSGQRLQDEYFHKMKDTFDPNQKRGMVDELLNIQKAQRESDPKTALEDVEVQALIYNVIAAAYLTSSSTLSILFLYLIENQEIQTKIYHEVKGVIGNSDPNFKHRQLMPYTEAAILEALRLSSLVPFLVPHLTRNDIVFKGYFIPKNTTLMMNSWYAHHRPDFWEDPFVFRPERFLDSNGKLVEADHPTRMKMMSFGAGRRSCPGETFGKSRVFLITTYLLQHFQFLPEESDPMPSSDPHTWTGKAILCPRNYRCAIKARSGE